MQRLLPLLFLLGTSAVMADTLRCGNALVYEGDEIAKVIARCGQPAQITHSVITRFPTVWINGRPQQLSNQQIEIPVETWVYNFGTDKFMRKLRFEDGVLVEITVLDRGFNPD